MKINKFRSTAIVVIGLFVSVLFSQQLFAGEDFTYQKPDGWEYKSFPGLKYEVSIGKPLKNFAPNIVVVDEVFSGTLEEYFKQNLAQIEKLINGAKIISQNKISTSDGDTGFKLAFTSEQNGRKLKQIQYFFGKDNRKYVLTCSILVESGDEFDNVFEKSAMTFKIR